MKISCLIPQPCWGTCQASQREGGRRSSSMPRPQKEDRMGTAAAQQWQEGTGAAPHAAAAGSSHSDRGTVERRASAWCCRWSGHRVYAQGCGGQTDSWLLVSYMPAVQIFGVQMHQTDLVLFDEETFSWYQTQTPASLLGEKQCGPAASPPRVKGLQECRHHNPCTPHNLSPLPRSIPPFVQALMLSCAQKGLLH